MEITKGKSPDDKGIFGGIADLFSFTLDTEKIVTKVKEKTKGSDFVDMAQEIVNDATGALRDLQEILHEKTGLIPAPTPKVEPKAPPTGRSAIADRQGTAYRGYFCDRGQGLSGPWSTLTEAEMMSRPGGPVRGDERLPKYYHGTVWTGTDNKIVNSSLSEVDINGRPVMPDNIILEE